MTNKRGEPEWVTMYEDTTGAVYLSKNPIDIQDPDEYQEVRFYLWMEITDMQEACNHRSVICSIGVCPHWLELSYAARMEVKNSSSPEVVEGMNEDIRFGVRVEDNERGLAEIARSYGIKATLAQAESSWTEKEENRKTFDVDKHWIKAKKACLKEIDLENISEAMLLPQNRLGQDAWSFMFEGIKEYLEKKTASPSATPEQLLMAKLHKVVTPHTVGKVAVTLVDQAMFQNCRFSIIDPKHYREDWSCKCDDAKHRAFMVKKWEYKNSDFDGIPLRKEQK